MTRIRTGYSLYLRNMLSSGLVIGLSDALSTRHNRFQSSDFGDSDCVRTNKPEVPKTARGRCIHIVVTVAADCLPARVSAKFSILHRKCPQPYYLRGLF
jgi:hypothetical protein